MRTVTPLPTRLSRSSLLPLIALINACFVPMACSAATESADSSASPTAQAPVSEATLPAVTVTGMAPQDGMVNLQSQVHGGALGARSQLDTPFSTTVVSAESLADRQVTKLGDVFALDASVSDNSGGYSSWASYITVRGLALDWQNAFRIDGKPFLSYSITLPYEQFEQIELLKGSSGFMYGFGSPGGLVNYVTKKPTDEPVRSVDVGYRTEGIWSEHVDLGGRFGNDDRFGYRLNATHEKGKTYNDGTINRDTFSLALDARLTRDLTWDFQSIYQHRRTEGQTPSIYLGNYTGSSLPDTVNPSNQKLLGAGQHLNTNFQLYSTGLKYNLADDWTLSTNVSHTTAKRARNEASLYLIDEDGNYNDYRSDTHEGHRFDQAQLMLEGKARTGWLEHQMVFGGAWQKQTNDYSGNSFYGLIGTGNLYAKNQNDYYSQGGYNVYKNSTITQKALFASDTVKFSDQWSVLGGLRYTNYAQTGYATDGATSSRYTKDGVITPTVALMFKPRADTTIYTSYVESLEPGSSVGSTYANYGALLRPLKSKQYELGVKTDQDGWNATAALFRIERKSEYANANNELVQNGESVYQGLELGATARLDAQWQLGGNLMFLDTAYRKGSDYTGNRVAGAPKFVATAQLAYTVPMVEGLKVAVNAKYTGNTSLRPANDLKVSGYTIANIGATYATRVAGYHTTFRLSVDNIANKRYWEYQYADYIKPGDPRTVSLNAKIDF